MLRKLLCILALISPLLVSAAPSTSGLVAEQQERLFAQVKNLSPFERRFIVLAVWNDLAVNNRNLLSDTPEHELWSLKVVAVEHVILSSIASKNGWPEMAALLKEAAIRMEGMIQGKQKSKTLFDAEVADWSRRYDKLLNETRQQWPREWGRPPSKESIRLRAELKTYIAAAARILNGSKKP